MGALSPLMEEVLQNAGEVTFMVTGNSMRPLLRHRRDKVCVVKPRETLLKKYDIPLFVRQDGKYILHRITSVKPAGYVVVGDNQEAKEYPVLHAQVIGVVKGIWRGEKYISCEDFRYRAYCRLWVFAYPFRRLYFKAKRFCVKAIRLLGASADEG
jgi:hypothetical protein